MKTTNGLTPDRAGLSAKSMSPQSIVPNKWQLLSAVEKSRVPLGLKGTTITVLRALLSFVPHDHISQQADDTHICFASNETLAERSHVSVPTVERHITKLVSLGLLNRTTNGNGKRWARRNHHGQIIHISGLSLLPLLQRYEELMGIAETYAHAQQAVLALRDRILQALAQLRDAAHKISAYERLHDFAKKLLRRKPNEAALSQLLEEIQRETRNPRSHETSKMRDSTHRNEGHKEPEINRSVEEKKLSEGLFTPQQMERAFPKLCAALRYEQTYSACEARMDMISKEVGMGDVWKLVKGQGPTISFMILGYVFERADDLRSPRRYVHHLLALLQRNELNLNTLLKHPIRRGGARAA